VRFALAAEPAAGARRRRAVLDPAMRLPGRGAYLCAGSEPGRPDAACLELARRRGGIARTLRCAVTIDVSS
jgi:predicted RNA-binding protein YlxR (DUF448 family)